MHNPADVVHFLGILLLLRFSLFFALVLFSTFWNERELLSNYRNTTLATHIRFHKLKEKLKRSMATPYSNTRTFAQTGACNVQLTGPSRQRSSDTAGDFVTNPSTRCHFLHYYPHLLLPMLGILLTVVAAQNPFGVPNCIGCYNATSGVCTLDTDPGGDPSCPAATPQDCAQINLPFLNNTLDDWCA